MSRRQALTWMGMAGAAGALGGGLRLFAQTNESVKRVATDIAQAPVAAVQDTASAIRISGVEVTAVGAAIFVKITTNKKVSGWGETGGPASVMVPLATGENVRTIWGFIPYLQERCIDVLQPDCGHCGGISQMRKIAALAETYYIPLAPHCIMTLLGLTASLHCAAATPLLLIHETYPHLSPPDLFRRQWSMDKKTGYVTLPQGNGLGVEVDEAKLAELAARTPRGKFPEAARHPDGSIADQ